MIKEIEQVKAFMDKAGQEVPLTPTMPNMTVKALRENLHYEEAVVELAKANMDNDLVQVLDSICDSLVVVYGSSLAYGFKPETIEAAFAEVMRSNMSKFIDGHRRADGKWVKGPSYSPANLEQFIK